MSTTTKLRTHISKVHGPQVAALYKYGRLTKTQEVYIILWYRSISEDKEETGESEADDGQGVTGDNAEDAEDAELEDKTP